MTSTIALAWELGRGYGHVHSLAAIGEALGRRGHRLVVIAKELHRAEGAFGGLGVPILQSPMGAPARAAPERLHSLGETLRVAGYDCVEHFGPIYRAWRVLLEAFGPSVVIGDYAPTAALAARALGIPRVVIGTGWTVPPLQVPMPNVTPWAPLPRREATLAAEGEVLAVINEVLSRCGDAPVHAVADVHEGTERWLLTFEELDHFGPRPDTTYWGTLAGGHGARPPVWPQGEGPRVFTYLSARYWDFERVVEHLGATGYPTLVYARDLGPARAAELSTSTLRFSPHIVDIDLAMKQAAVFVSHGGHGTVSRALLHGRPLLVLPEHDEQALMGHHLAAQGLAIDVGLSRDRSNDYAPLLRSVVEGGSHARAAQAFAARHAGFDQAASVRALADRCERLLG